MRNLKKLFAVIMTVAMLVSLMVPALAATDNTDKALKLQAIDVMAGGVDDLNLGDDLTRIQALTFAIRAAGKDAEALALTADEIEEIFEGWVDVADAADWQKPYIAYAIREKITAGVGGGRFASMELADGPQLLRFLLIAGMGYDPAEVTTANAVEFAVNVGILTASEATMFANDNFLIRDDAVVILYGAFTTGKNADGTKLIDAYIASGATTEAAAAAAGFVESISAMSVTAIGARKLEIKFDKAVDSDKAKIEVKRGTVKPSVKSITFADDKKSAVIEFNTDMAEGDYTVTVTGLTEEALTATIKVEAAKLITIKFLSEILIKSEDSKTATTTVVAENQYGEEVNKKLPAMSITSSKGSAAVNKDGLVTLTEKDGDLFKVDEKIVVTIVDAGTGAVGSKTLSVATAALVSSIEFGVLSTDDKDLKGKDVNVGMMNDKDKAGKFYLPIKVKDQYGTVLKAADLDKGFNMMSSNKEIINIDKIDDTDDYGTVIKFAKTEGTGKDGTAVITVVAVGTGKTANATIVIKANPEIDTVTLYAPEDELKQTVEVTLPMDIINTYGEEVSVKDANPEKVSDTEIKFGEKTKLTATNAKLKIDPDYVKDTQSIKITPADDAKNVIITVTTSTGKFNSLTLSVSDKPVPTSIKGLKDDFAAMLANDTSLTTKVKGNIIFLDQYGEEIDNVEHAYVENLAEVADRKTDTEYDVDGNLVIRVVDEGTDTYKISLYENKAKMLKDEALDSFEFDVKVVKLADIKEFKVEDLKKFYTGKSADDKVTAADYDQDVKIYGVVDGKKVVVNQNMIKYASGLEGVSVTSGAAIYLQAEIDTEGKDKDATLSLLIDNGDATFSVKQAIVYSSAAPKADSVVFQKLDDTEWKDIEGEAVSSTDGTDIRALSKDQYGVENAEQGKFNIVKTSVAYEDDKVTEKSYQLNAFIDGIYKSIKVIIEK